MLEIRHYEETDDFDEISRIYALSWKTAYRGIIPDGYLDSISETRWSSILKLNCRKLMLALDDGHIVGASIYDSARDAGMKGWGEIISLYLLPAYYRKGIGTKLFLAVVQELISQGYESIYLWVLEDNSPSRVFYEKNGFTCGGDINADNIGGKTVNEIRYVFRINKK